MAFLRYPAALALALALVAVGAEARADEPVVTVHEFDARGGPAVGPPDRFVGVSYLNVGPMFSFVDSNSLEANVAPGHSSAWNYAFGVETSLTHYRSESIRAFGYGAFVQTLLQNAKYFRGDLGGQINYGPAGLELGLGVRQGDGTFGTTASLHVGFFISLGYFVLSYRASPALFSFPTNEPSFGFDTGVSIALKLPIVVQGTDGTQLALQPGRR